MTSKIRWDLMLVASLLTTHYLFDYQLSLTPVPGPDPLLLSWHWDLSPFLLNAIRSGPWLTCCNSFLSHAIWHIGIHFLSAYTNEPYHLFSSGCLFFLSLSHCYPIRCTSFLCFYWRWNCWIIHWGSQSIDLVVMDSLAPAPDLLLSLLPLPLWSTPLKLGVPLIDSAVPLGGLPPLKFRVPGKRIP